MNEDIRSQLAETEIRYPFPAAEIERTRHRKWILRFARKNGVGAEIGVFRGHFAECLMEVLRPRKIYLVDPWTTCGPVFDFVGGPYTNEKTLPTPVARCEVQLRAQKFPGSEAVLIEDEFPRCAARINEQLDWAYLDASHEYDRTLAELKGLNELVGPEGVIMGDDWFARPDHPVHGVFRAVNDFAKQFRYDVVAAGRKKQWCIRRTP